MEYRIDKNKLIDILKIWDSFIRREIRLIACGGTALTLLGIKPSTKDIDFLVPAEAEYSHLIKLLKDLGYKNESGFRWIRDDGFVFDIFRGKHIHTTEILFSPLRKGGNICIEIGTTHIYVGALNFYDLIISKIFRGTSADIEDSISLLKIKREQIDLKKLLLRYKKTASYDINPKRMLQNLSAFLKQVNRKIMNVDKIIKEIELWL
ncbi:hypothetical protein AUJ66_01695 [Candidatus Desantisbacteria bacterium CG1_02_38_46]|uniref:DUF6036 domain-containing protein n=3 Tax=unclassified Candidatus Desantisiibacteriota TaxID=3106372 RepID=A0A2H9PAT7_9BACT|nr:MAG: hypothetical protein AUJ66_01695 [Candidatus Desantisbacteria bacterium CG1_02_38_46]PIU50809.1 MAG: hypothetical protein COS91_07730 [Candidatus Desantisbacteria bacterium CG07_land_8_20_14_0_80_39_15]PIZ15641.1 MAG: hypothetical protein COY51_04705 [Candidatus Desantisbacteria bacterium CG_4_10_14_0_8_um_filter_39_17]